MSDVFRITNEAFQMKEHHLELLSRNRSYLLHNLCPGETFWGALLEMGVFDADMLDEMKSQRTRTERVGLLLDLLPHRGPEAFDAFLEALLKCGHGFVADYLKILEVSDQFKTDIKTYNISDHIQDRLIRTYKKSLPNVQRFFETKLEVNLQEQESEFQDKEREISDLEQQSQTLESMIQETKQWFSHCVRRTNTLGNELKRTFVLRSALREERKNLEALYEKVSSDDKHEQLVSKFCDSMYSIIDYIEISEDRKASLEHLLNCGDDDDEAQQNGTNGKTITSKVQGVIDLVTGVMENTVGEDIMDLDLEKDIRCELEKTVSKMKEIIKDLSYVKRIFLTTLRKKEDLSQETLSLVHNFREIRRLEKERIEKQDHIQELRTRGQTIKNKSKRHKRFLEQIQEEIGQKEKQLTELYDHLQKQVNSADQRVHFILNLLPDSGEADGPHTLADDTRSEGGFSLLSKELTYISIVKDRSDSRFSLTSEQTDITLKAQSTSTPAPPKTPVPSATAATETRAAPVQKASKDTVDNKPKSAVDNNKASIENKARSAYRQPDPNLTKQLPKTPNAHVQETPRSVNNQAKAKASSLKDSQSSTGSSSSHRKSPSPPGSAKNKVAPAPPLSTQTATPPTPPEKTKGAAPPPTQDKTKSFAAITKPEPKQIERRLAMGNVSSGAESAVSTSSTDKQQTNLIQVKPAEGSNLIKTKSTKVPEKETKEVKKPNALPSQQQRHYHTKPGPPSPSQPISKFSAAAERFSNKSMEPLSISSARSGVTANTDAKSPNASEKNATQRQRSPVPTPRFSIKPSQNGHNRFDPSVLMTDRPVPAARTKKMSVSDEKDSKTTNGSATPHIQYLKEDSKSPLSRVSSKPLLRLQNGDAIDSILAGSTFPPGKKQNRAKSMDHVMLGTRPTSNKKIITQNESVYNRVSDAINKVKDRASTKMKEQHSNNHTKTNAIMGSITSMNSLASGSEVSRSNLANPRLSLSTESSEGQVGDLWIQSSSSDDGNTQHDTSVDNHTNRIDKSLNGISIVRGSSTSILSNQQIKAELDLKDSMVRKPRTLSAETHASSRSRHQAAEDPNKYPQRQVLMANKVQLN